MTTTWLFRVLAILIVLGAAARAVAVVWPPVRVPVEPRAEDRATLQRLLADRDAAIWQLDLTSVITAQQPQDDPFWQRLSSLGVTRVDCQRFDSAAEVVLVPGPDGAPGRVDWDDDGNGVIDDRSEFGATGSDDPVVVRGGDDAAEIASQSLILQRGAYRPDSFAAAPSTPTHPVRLWIHR